MIINQASVLIFSLAAAIISNVEGALPDVDGEEPTQHKHNTNTGPVHEIIEDLYTIDVNDSTKDKFSGDGTRRIKSATVMKQIAKKVGKELLKDAAKDFIKDEFGSTSDENSCWEDYNSLNFMNLPLVSEDDIAQACVFDSKFELIYTASIHCDFIQSFVYTNFQSVCEGDSRFHMVPVEIITTPGEGNFYVTDDAGIVYEIFSVHEKNVPICFPKSCNYLEAVSIIEGYETYMENVIGYDNSEYIIPSSYNSAFSSGQDNDGPSGESGTESSGSASLGFGVSFWLISVVGLWYTYVY